MGKRLFIIAPSSKRIMGKEEEFIIAETYSRKEFAEIYEKGLYKNVGESYSLESAVIIATSKGCKRPYVLY